MAKNNWMKEDLILKRSLNIDARNVIGSIAKATNREDMMIVLKFVKESKNPTAESFVKKIFFEDKSRLVVARRLWKISELLRLTKLDGEKYSLTNDGREALKKKTVFVPEDGTWTLSVSDDSLLPHNVIEIAPFKEPSSYDEVWGKDKDNSKKRSKNMETLPDWVKTDVKRKLTPHLGGEECRIDNLEKKGEKVEKSLTITLEWNVTQKTVQLFKDQKVVKQFAFPKTPLNDVWNNLLKTEDLLDDWDEESERLAIRFEGTDEAARQTMHEAFDFDPDIDDGLGKFDKVHVNNVPLRAETKEDAQKWAEWRLDNAIDNFAIAENYEQWSKKAQAPFEEYEVLLPDRNEHAHELWQETREAPTNRALKTKAWYLMAAEDWNL